MTSAMWWSPSARISRSRHPQRRNDHNVIVLEREDDLLIGAMISETWSAPRWSTSWPLPVP